MRSAAPVAAALPAVTSMTPRGLSTARKVSRRRATLIWTRASSWFASLKIRVWTPRAMRTACSGVVPSRVASDSASRKTVAPGGVLSMFTGTCAATTAAEDTENAARNARTCERMRAPSPGSSTGGSQPVRCRGRYAERPDSSIVLERSAAGTPAKPRCGYAHARRCAIGSREAHPARRAHRLRHHGGVATRHAPPERRRQQLTPPNRSTAYRCAIR